MRARQTNSPSTPPTIHHHRYRRRLIITTLFLSIVGIRSNTTPSFVVQSFTPSPKTTTTAAAAARHILSSSSISHIPSSSSLKATPNNNNNTKKTSKNRSKILNRNGSHFDLNRFAGTVEFGFTANLITQLNTSNKKIAATPQERDRISQWLSDERNIAASIWKDDLITNLGDSVYRLQLMTLQFVTIQLAPQVDTAMWIETNDTPSSNTTPSINIPNSSPSPIFKLQSIDFDPQIKLLPGLPNLSPESLGIQIEVVGELRPTSDGKGVTGRIGFVSGGKLPPPMRVLPEGVLKGGARVICDTVSRFVLRGFEKGAVKKYGEFCRGLDEEEARVLGL